MPTQTLFYLIARLSSIIPVLKMFKGESVLGRLPVLQGPSRFQRKRRPHSTRQTQRLRTNGGTAALVYRHSSFKEVSTGLVTLRDAPMVSFKGTSFCPHRLTRDAAEREAN